MGHSRPLEKEPLSQKATARTEIREVTVYRSCRSLFTGEAADVLDEGPDLIVCQLISISNEAGIGGSVLNHPEEFAFRAMDPESLVLKIAW